VTVRHKTGKEAQPCAPARCWAYYFLRRKEGARKGPRGSCVQPSVKAVHAAPAQAPIRWCARKVHVVAASIRRDHEGPGKTNRLVGKETRREFKK
jgi:hypothetical protein